MNRKKIIAIMLVMMIVGVACLFAETSNTMNGVYISWTNTGYSKGSATVTNNNGYAITVYYTVYYEDGGQVSGNVFCPNGNGSTVGINVGGYGNRAVENIQVISVRR